MEDNIAAFGELQITDLSDSNHEDLVTLLVGPEQRKMIVNGTSLARDSEFLKAALKKEWIEGQTRTIALSEECSEVMAQYITYTTSGILSSEDRVYKTWSDFHPIYRSLVTLYVYSERFINTAIQKAVINELIRLVKIKSSNGGFWVPCTKDINIIYRGMPETSPARRLLVDIHVSITSENAVSDDLEHAFLVDVAKTFHRLCFGSRKRLFKITLEAEDYI
jgi:hypothetical protein